MILGDTHFRLNAPIGRKDNFRETVLRKWQFIIDTAIQNDIQTILQPGDLFDSPNLSLSTIEFSRILMQLQEHSIDLITIPGQHDMMMRSKNIQNTQMGFFYTMRLLNIAGQKPIHKFASIYGNHFGNNYEFEDEFILNKNDDYRILLTHDMIGDKPLFPGHELKDTEQFLEEHSEFDLIICGDYHYPYHYSINDRHIVNCGCLVRLSRDERDINRHPYILIAEFYNKVEFTKIDIPIELPELVFNPIDEKDDFEHYDLDLFIEKLKRKEKIGIGFLDNLLAFYKEHDVSNEIKTLIEEVLQ